MTSKQCFLLFLAFTLVALFCATGVFADSGQNVSINLGSESLELTQVRVVGSSTPNVYCVLPEYDFSNIGTSWTEFDSFPLFNGVSVTIEGRVDPTPAFRFNFYIDGVYCNRFVATYEQGYVLSLGFQNVNGQPTLIGGYTSTSGSVYMGSILNITLSQMDPIPTSGSSVVYTVISSAVGEVIPFTLEPGYAYIISGPCEISDRTYSIVNSWNFVKLASSRINGSFERTVPTASLIYGFSPDRYLTVEQLLPWWADNANVVGVASNYSYHNTDVITLSDTGNNYVLGYPLYYQGSGDYSTLNENAVSLSGSIYITYTGSRPSIRKIAFESVPEIVEGHYHYYNVFRPDVYDETGDVVSDGSGGVVVDFPDGPQNGGNSGEPPANEETNLFGILSKFINDIKNLISQGSHAISELVNYGSQFMRSIATMFDWLPSTLVTLIVSAFSIVLVIGVIKLLWK